MPLTVNATLKAKDGKEEALFAVLKALVAPTRAEKGCIFYDMHKSDDEPGLFFRPGRTSLSPTGRCSPDKGSRP